MLAPNSSRMCYYHRKFGEAARQCRQLCTWSGNDKASSGLGGKPLQWPPLPLRLCHQMFLVDTSTEVSVLPATGLDTRTRKQGPPLLAPNGSSIRMYRTHKLPLHLASNTYQWNFIIADVTRPLPGTDFLRSNSLLVDVKGKWLMDAATYHSAPLGLTCHDFLFHRLVRQAAR